MFLLEFDCICESIISTLQPKCTLRVCELSFTYAVVKKELRRLMGGKAHCVTLTNMIPGRNYHRTRTISNYLAATGYVNKVNIALLSLYQSLFVAGSMRAWYKLCYDPCVGRNEKNSFLEGIDFLIWPFLQLLDNNNVLSFFWSKYCSYSKMILYVENGSYHLCLWLSCNNKREVLPFPWVREVVMHQNSEKNPVLTKT